jgi:cellulose synthase/poly-beta-1,6-N-acetylglucosamine synthase-like glycosyltransferase
VVDNAPLDEKAEVVAAHHGAGYVKDPVPGLSHARNVGARAAKGEIVAYIDDDSFPTPTWLSHLVSEFDSPEVMAVAGSTHPLGSRSEANGEIASREGSIFVADQRRVLCSKSRSWFEIANFGGIGLGNNMAFRKRAFDRWPGFDERLGRGRPLDGSEEHYAFFSLLKRGYKVAFTPHALVHHPVLATEAELRCRRLKDLSNATAYLTFLFFEERGFRQLTLRYLATAFSGTRRRWRPNLPEPRTSRIEKWRALVALVSGPLVYIKSCRTPKTVHIAGL